MADDEFNIDELVSGNGESAEDVVQPDTRNTNNTVNTSSSQNTANTIYPFSVRLDQEYVELIKALAWWKRISQREFIEQAIDQYLKNIDSKELKDILNQYHENN